MSFKSAVPETLSVQQRSNVAPSEYYAPVSARQEAPLDAPSVPIAHYLWVLRRHWLKIVVFVAACVLVTAIVSARLPKVYESTATIAIDAQTPSQPVGQDFVPLWIDWDAFIETQIRLIQSDSVLRPVAEQFQLSNADASGRNSEKSRDNSVAHPGLGEVKVVRPKGAYLLLISYRSTSPDQAADIANAVAKSYLAHTYDVRVESASYLSSFLERQLDELKAKMEKSNLALAQFEKDLDVISPDEKTNILSAQLLQLNTEYINAQADRVNKEAAWDTVKSGSLAAVLVSPQGGAITRLSDNLTSAQQHYDLVKSVYGSDHPEYRKAATAVTDAEKELEQARAGIVERVAAQYREALNREQMLGKAVAESKAESDRLNARSFEYQQVKREADADTSLYDELIRKIREADINSGFRNNNVSIADPARPSTSPVFPNTRLYLLMAFLLSSFFGICGIVLYDSFDTTLRDPASASRFLGTEVIGSLPIDRASAQFPRAPASAPSLEIVSRQGADPSRKNYYQTTSNFDEAVRSLRNTIFLSDFEGRLRSLVITSAIPGEGKSTLATHLGIANGDQGKRTLLVDGDLRRPGLHAKFGLSPREGLSNVLNGERAWQDVVMPIEGRPNLALLPSGPGSHRAADLIGPRLSSLLDELAKEYDLVILDSPPLMGFAECLQMAAAADGVLIVSRAASTNRKAVAAVISALDRIHANKLGIVLNQVDAKTSVDSYAYQGYYGYNQDGKQEA